VHTDEFRVLVCGGRDYSGYVRLRRVLDAVHEGARAAGKVLVIIHGNARGADLLADQYARERSLKALSFPADWANHGRSAGPIRNKLMLTSGQPHVIIAFRGGKGTADMIQQGKTAGVPVYEVKE
jgi:hypothetical protein